VNSGLSGLSPGLDLNMGKVYNAIPGIIKKKSKWFLDFK
jgi:hypothetical protein